METLETTEIKASKIKASKTRLSEYKEKCQRLHALIHEYARRDLAVAFSGGADSALLLKLAVLHGMQQKSQVYAMTASTELHPLEDISLAKRVAEETGAKHVVLTVSELKEAGISDNPQDRCYRCKHYLFQAILKEAGRMGAETLLEGTNADDLLAYRPGLKAIRQLGVQSPLLQAGFTKEEVRRLAGEYGISVADRPSAPCLATRFPYGAPFTVDGLRRVEQGEQILKTLGLYNVRLRIHGEIARIEVDPDNMGKLLANREEMIKGLKALGYSYITMDLEGFRSGSMDVGHLTEYGGEGNGQ